MTPDIVILFVIIILGLALFSLEVFPIEVTALGMLIALILFGLLPADMAFQGFGSDTALMMFGILVLTASLEQTGVADLAGRLMLRGEDLRVPQLVAIIMVVAAVFSAFMGNTATAAFFLPIVLGISRRMKVSASKLLMPLAFATILASSVTLISTSTNVIVNGLMEQQGLPGMKMFELAPVGVPIAVIGVLYMLFIGRRMVPNRISEEEVSEGITHRVYITELIVPPGSPLAGQTLDDLDLRSDLDLNVLRIIRDEDHMLVPDRDTHLQEEDSLLVQGPREEILYVKGASRGIAIKPEYKFSDPEMDTADIELAELLVLPGSSLVGRTVKGLRFRDQYGLQIIGVDHAGEKRQSKLSEVRLEVGDVLLVQGDRQSIKALGQDDTFRILGRIQPPPQARDRRPIAIAIFAGSILAATFNLVPLSVAMLIGAVLSFVTRCITPEEAYNNIQWTIIFLIGSMLGVGAAMEQTGAAGFLATEIVSFIGQQPRILLTAFFLLTVLLTQPMSNQAAAAVVFPVAITTAHNLGLNPRTFAMMIAVAASTSFITPLEPACLLIYGPGRYQFFDFVRVGLPLTLIIYGIAILLVPWVWPLL